MAQAKLVTLGFTNEYISPQTKARLFVTFIRSILFYGAENCNLNAKQIDMLKRTEGNILKKFLYILRDSKSTELFNSFDLDTTSNHLKKQKLSFYLQLRQNSYTNAVLVESTKINIAGTFLQKIRSLLNVTSAASLETLDERSKTEISDMKLKVRKKKEQSNLVKSLILAYEIKAPRARTLQIRSLLTTNKQIATM